MPQPINTLDARRRERTGSAGARPGTSIASCTASTVRPRRKNCGISRMHIEIMSAITGAALPSSASTLSYSSIDAAASNHNTLATNSPPMHRPYTMLSRYTARMPIRNSSVEPEALNSGLSTATIKITGSCQRSAPSVQAAPRVANPYASPPASDSAISTGCIENIVSPSVSTI